MSKEDVFLVVLAGLMFTAMFADAINWIWGKLEKKK